VSTIETRLYVPGDVVVLICEADTTNQEAVFRTQLYAQNVAPAMSIPRDMSFPRDKQAGPVGAACSVPDPYPQSAIDGWERRGAERLAFPRGTV
jgi:hypothetical protein